MRAKGLAYRASQDERLEAELRMGYSTPEAHINTPQDTADFRLLELASISSSLSLTSGFMILLLIRLVYVLTTFINSSAELPEYVAHAPMILTS